jgi:rod shape determining protein RodA
MPRAAASWVSRFDWVLVALTTALSVIGIMNLYSASVALQDSLYVDQVVWFVLGLGLIGAVMLFDYRAYERWSYVIYVVALGMLLAVFFVGATLNNSRRWLDVGFTRLQPSELNKIATILAVARFSADHPAPEGYSLVDLKTPLALAAVPAVLIMLQPDLGTSLLVLFIAGTMLLFLGIRLRSLLFMFSAGLVSAPLMWIFALHDYQKTRILSFLDLERDKSGAGWQVSQSLIAFGAGGPTGQGYLQGMQVQNGFVPYHESDFAAVSWGEEMGFLGMVGMLGLYAALIAWAIRIARNARDRFGMSVAVGVASLFFWHVSVNLGMVLGMLPVVGVTLPLVSNGGSSFLTVMIGVGLLMNISLRRHVF